MAGIYVHIPFCASRCIYCGFYSTTMRDMQERYVSAVGREAALRADYLGQQVETVYIGGGTPSQLPIRLLRRLTDSIRGCFDIKDDAEMTIECNPDDMTPEYARGLKMLGANRVSMGIQSFDNRRLQFLHRRHDAATARRAVDLLRSAGFSNLSIDLMYGFPGQTLDEWANDVDAAIALDVPHLSAYSLMYEEGTVLTRRLERGEIRELDEETCRSMYELLYRKLKAHGYEHYEISNFAKPGFHSRHNSSYWNETPYVGLGAAAHSYDKVSRQWNVPDLRQYVDAIESGRVPCERELIDEQTRYNDLIATALRTSDGMDLNTLPDRQRSYCLRMAQPHLRRGTLALTADASRLRLTPQGIFVSDDIMSDLVWVE